MGYILGLDVGIASLGFAGVTIDEQRIDFAGVHLFNAAEHPKTGSSLAFPRRMARGQRRVIRRRAQRKKHIRHLLIKYGFNQEAIAAINLQGIINISVWNLRVEALERKLTDAEFSRILFHIAKRRGFQSNSKKSLDKKDTEGKKALAGLNQLTQKVIESRTTVGAHLAMQPKQRNGRDNYEYLVTRDLLRDEIDEIFKQQRKFGHTKASEALQQEYKTMAFEQRPLRSVEHLVGYCSLEKDKKRAPKNAYSTELFVLWSKLHTLRLVDTSGKSEKLTLEQKKKIDEFAHKNEKVTYLQIRKELNISDENRFNSINYNKIKKEQNTWEAICQAAEKSTFIEMKGYHIFKKVFENNELEFQEWIGAGRETLDDIARILAFSQDTREIETSLSKIVISEGTKESFKKINNFSGTISLSLEAVRKILPFMQQGLSYDKACNRAGYQFNSEENLGKNFVGKFNATGNPVVDRALTQARKVINAIIRRYGLPEKIVVELARELGKSLQDRKALEKQMNDNRELKKEDYQDLQEILKREPNGTEALKHRLWKEQGGFCAYSNRYIEPGLLGDPTATQIDHILPYSLSFDNSYLNKLLCFSDENQKKGNRIPYDYLGNNPIWNELVASFSNRFPRKKLERFLMKEFDEEKQSEWKARHLNDTRYISRHLKQHLERELGLGKGNRVQARNGALTAHLRHVWGFPDKDRSNARHHALDAIVLACSTQKMVEKLTNDYIENKTSSTRARFPRPWPNFQETAKQKIDEVFVSRMPRRKMTGKAHQETIRSIRGNEQDGYVVVQKMRLCTLKPNLLENLVEKEGRNKNLYHILKTRLDLHGGDPKRAFAEPIKLVGKQGEEKAAPIHSVKIITDEKSGLKVNGGFASNGDMIRVDVFQKKKKYYLCPVYAHHRAQKKLPMGLISGKSEKDWLPVDESYQFLFSLYSNDLVRLVKKGNEYLGYYTTVDRSTGRIRLVVHDNDTNFGKNGFLRIGVQSLDVFEKYIVNYFGEKQKVKGEKRLGLAKSTRTKSSTIIAKKCTAATEE